MRASAPPPRRATFPTRWRSDMAQRTPTTTFDPEYSSPSASAIAWSTGQRALGAVQIYWLATVRPDGRPHLTPLIAVWLDGRLYFSTGDEERKAKNLAE